MTDRTPTQIYMPLRSNAAWFGDAEARTRLERQIKTNLLLYDRLLLQDGRYHLTAGEDGQGMEMMHPGSSFPGDRTTIEYYSPGLPFYVAVAGKQILTGKCQTAYDVDFLPIIRDAGLEHAACIRWSNMELLPPSTNAIERQAEQDLLTPSYANSLPENSYVRRMLLRGLYRDGIVARELKLPFSVDFNAATFLVSRQQDTVARWAPEIPGAFLQYWVHLQLPDLANLGWPEFCEFRESSVGQSFRDMVHRVSTRVREVLPEISDQQELDSWIAREFSKELLQELSRRVRSPGRSLFSMALNFIPFGFVPDIAMDATALDADQNSWVSLVTALSEKC